MSRRAVRFIVTVVQDLRANPLPLTLTVFALTIGIVAIVLTSVVGAVAKEVFIAKEEQRTARGVTFSATINRADPAGTDLVSLARRLNEPLSQAGGSAAIVSDVSGVVLNSSGTEKRPGALHVYWGNYASVRRLPALSGRLPVGGLYPPRIAVNSAAGLRVGEAVKLTLDRSKPRVDARVAAVVADGSTDPSYYVPGELCEELFRCTPNSVTVLLHTTANKENSALFIQRFSSTDRFVVTDFGRIDSVDSIEDQLRILQFIFGICGLAALCVSAIGMLNLGLATIRHRGRELSIRRALGASRADMFRLVIGSALATGVLGAGVALGIVTAGLALVVPRLIDPATAVDAPSLPWSAVVLASVTGLLTALLGAVAPALRASRVDIAQVLRD
jgi:putative ABC transport system permease protein